MNEADPLWKFSILWRQGLAKSREHLSNIWRTPSSMCLACNEMMIHTLQGTNISHLGKRNIIFKMPFLGDMLVPWRVWLLPHILLILCLLFWGIKLYWAVAKRQLVWPSIGCCFTSVCGCSIQDLLLFSALLEYHDQHHMVCCPKVFTKIQGDKESPPDVCIGLQKWRVAQHGQHITFGKKPLSRILSWHAACVSSTIMTQMANPNLRC